MLFENLDVHDQGRRGLSIINYGSTDISNIIVQDSEFYDGFHTTGPDIETGGTGGATGDLSNILIQRCVFSEDSATVGTVASQLVFAQGPHGDIGEIHDLTIINCVFKYSPYRSILLEEVDTSLVAYNTFVNHSGIATANTYHMVYTDDCTEAVFKNNILFSDRNTDANDQGFAIYEAGNQDYTNITTDYNLYWRIDDFTIWYVNGTEYYRSQWTSYKSATSWDGNSPDPADPLFISRIDDLRLDTDSPAEGTATPIPWITTDILGNARDETTPDMGAYEKQ